ncbi:MAG TPA: hypothetical protein VJW75_03645, partial [Candidatus Eisenbacteria bacterium]|nr:hypothetical protein [Candidatus Eisenbacteria bacterium]
MRIHLRRNRWQSHRICAGGKGFGAVCEGKPPDVWRDRLARLAEEIRAGRAALLVAELRGAVIGYGTIAFFSPPAGSPDNVAPEGWYL